MLLDIVVGAQVGLECPILFASEGPDQITDKAAPLTWRRHLCLRCSWYCEWVSRGDFAIADAARGEQPRLMCPLIGFVQHCYVGLLEGLHFYLLGSVWMCVNGDGLGQCCAH